MRVIQNALRIKNNLEMEMHRMDIKEIKFTRFILLILQPDSAVD